MVSGRNPSGDDPRTEMSDSDLAAANRLSAPQVGQAHGFRDSFGLAAGIIGAAAIGAITFVTLSNQRTPPAEPARQLMLPAPEPPPPPSPIVREGTVAPRPLVQAAPPEPAKQSRTMPMIIDNTAGVIPPPVTAAMAAPPIAPAPIVQPAQLTMDEQFSSRMGNDKPATAQAVSLNDPSKTIVQGAIIPAVLETSLNSDLPGFARAIVSNDIRSFDGKNVLIPRGSRLIGQYKSGLAIGQTRAFIIWTRLIRTDGASVQIASPVTDTSGAAGLYGKVDRHFFQRFGAAMLMSVVGAVPAALSDSTSNAFIISTSSQAQSAAAVALADNGKIPPTIRVAQGTTIHVFTARDLDFSGI